ncbi:MAG: DUF1566 domain-containing protein [Desulfobacteraceae bacterium]|nr:MAG: DUF1566 domain-containing protein [Desulfobacteraceae bacterium]
MKKGTSWLVPILIAIFMIAGCGKKSGLEGKIVDYKGQPLSGLNVIAHQVQPIEGYAEFETATGQDGKFLFKDFYPSSDYVISVRHKDWRSDAVAQVTAGPGGKTIKLKEPIRILFAVSGDGVITDFTSGLEWMGGPDEDTNWDAAQAWCLNLSVAGGGWRMPTRTELNTLYNNGFGKRNLTSIFKKTVWGVWSGEHLNNEKACDFDFTTGLEAWRLRTTADYERAFAVRSPK